MRYAHPVSPASSACSGARRKAEDDPDHNVLCGGLSAGTVPLTLEDEDELIE
jgi:hypothetical protein